MRGSFFGLRSGANSVVGSPVQTPAAPQSQPQPQQPGSRPDSGVYISDVEPLSLPPSAAGDVAVPSSGAIANRARPLSRLGLAAFRKPSPAPRTREATVNGATGTTAAVSSRVPSPPASPAPAAIAGGTGSVSYLDGLSLRLGEAVSKALILPSVAPITVGMGIAKAAHVASTSTAKSANGLDGVDMVLKGKKPLPLGRGRALGALIAGELQSASQDSFLYRAVLRLLQRPLSVLLTNLTTQVTNLILTPEFVSVSTLAPLNATQVHALALAHFASELLETFDAIGLGRSSQRNQATPDGLRSDKEALESVVSRVIIPFLTTIKREVGAGLAEFEKDPGMVGQLEKTLLRIAPILTRVAFVGEPNQSQFVQSLLAQLEIGTIWGCLTALAGRSLPRPTPNGSSNQEEQGGEVRRSVSAAELRNRAVSDAALLKSGGESSPTADYVHHLPSYVTPPDTPQVAPVKESPLSEKEKRLSFSSTTKAVVSSQAPLARTLTPPTPASKKLSLPKLPSLKPLTASRAPSPPHGHALRSTLSEKSGTLSTSTSSSSVSSKASSDFVLSALKTLARDTLVIFTAIKRLPLPLEGGLARDAVDEASKEMDGFLAFIEYLTIGESLDARLADIDALMRKTRATPMLLSMPLLLRVALITTPSARAVSDVVPDTVAGWIGLSEMEYRDSCLSGFRKADECAPIVGKAFSRNRMIGALGWMKEWVERSTREEEDSEDSEDDEECPHHF